MRARAYDPSAKRKCLCNARMGEPFDVERRSGGRFRVGLGQGCRSWQVIRIGAALSDHCTRLSTREIAYPESVFGNVRSDVWLVQGAQSGSGQP